VQIGSAALLFAALSVAAGMHTPTAGANDDSSTAFGFSSGPDIRPEPRDDDSQTSPERAQPQSPDASGILGSQPEASAADAWWKSDRNDGFRLLRAGSYGNAPADSPAVALMFSQPLSQESALSEHLRVVRPDDEPLDGEWRLAPSPYVAFFTVPARGRYRIEVDADLASAGGQALGVSLSGPVFVR